MTVAATAFGAICADPPWDESGGGKIKRGADKHYPLLNTHDIPRVMMSAPEWRPANDSHLYLWVTNNFLPDGMWVMSMLGFRYVTNIAWVKDKSGLGVYFRGKHELILFGVRGVGINARTERRNLSTVFDDAADIDGLSIGAPRGIHSAKPADFRELIEQRSRGPHLEMFCRGEPRPGWTAWGNELAGAGTALEGRCA